MNVISLGLSQNQKYTILCKKCMSRLEFFSYEEDKKDCGDIKYTITCPICKHIITTRGIVYEKPYHSKTHKPKEYDWRTKISIN